MSKKNFFLIIALVLLIGLAYIYQGPYKNWQERRAQPKNFLAGINVEKINKIEVIKDGEATILLASGSKWKIDGTKDFYVSDSNANSLISDLKELVVAQLEVVSQNKDKKSDFGTDEDSGVVVKLEQDNNEMASFVVGKLSSDYMNTYISPINSDKTYQVKLDIYSLFSQDDWYDKTIFASDKTKINNVRFQIGGKEFTIVKQGEDWYATGTKSVKLSNDKVASVIDLMASLLASKIPEQKFDGTGLEKNQLIIQVTGDSIDNTLIIGSDNGNDLYYAKKGDSDNIYLITKTERDGLNKQLKDLQ
ncbi:MAG: hypothetical protein BWY51_00081 [Parcubacteria group bacterium ADurb.Bin316]|nr:MAG: hypothetical protein BWY51_00081 [Parcubacteria group bacterium ADurb.Bin316]HOZ56257.1 DUF4340 domain-containing protein [bacterium]